MSPSPSTIAAARTWSKRMRDAYWKRFAAAHRAVLAADPGKRASVVRALMQLGGPGARGGTPEFLALVQRLRGLGVEEANDLTEDDRALLSREAA